MTVAHFQIIAKVTIVAPPSTGAGMVVIAAPNLGKKPAIKRKTAPSPTICRLITPVREIRPTFWLYDAVGSELNIDAKVHPNPFAIIPPESSRVVGSL